ncbi:uncharacterized protein LOC128956845 [Oppia nitens]|uniref:uncharacterized protein LOC128956845 n=1 Tax=Oppia nitens TaxID=1686743 RepID=UPI0023D9A07D|nr:uncharacterized protein LOC128956845 [Oppia nitens]
MSLLVLVFMLAASNVLFTTGRSIITMLNYLCVLWYFCCCYVDIVRSDAISIPIQSHRTFEIEGTDSSGGGQYGNSNGGGAQVLNVERDHQYEPHVFEVEPVQAPLRIVFSSESSPLTVDVEKAFQQYAAPIDGKQDRSGGVSAAPVASSSAGASGAAAMDGEHEYRVIDSYQRYVPVKVRADSFENIFAGTESHGAVAVIKSTNPKSSTGSKKRTVKKVAKVVSTSSSMKQKSATQTTTSAGTTSPTTTTPTTKTTAKPDNTGPAAAAPVASESAPVATSKKFGSRLANKKSN